MSNFIVIGPKGSESATRNAVFGEISRGGIENAAFLCNTPPRSGPARLAYRFFTSPRLNRKRHMPLYDHWEIGLRSLKAHLLPEENNIVIFCPSTRIFERIPGRLPELLREEYTGHIKLVFYLIDSVARTAQVNHTDVATVLTFLRRFDLVCTYDANDAIAHGFPYVDIPLWQDSTPASAPIDTSLYFSGRDKLRGRLLMDVYQRMKNANVRCHFRIVDSHERGLPPAGIHYEKWLNYIDTVNETRRTNCILELLADGNSGATLRYREAVMYNKKLLSNNPKLSRMPCYDPRWMHCFEKADDIDPAWVAAIEPVDYHYDGSFSAMRFLQTIEALCR